LPVKNAMVKFPIIKLPVVHITERNLSTSAIYLDSTLLISSLFLISSSAIYFILIITATRPDMACDWKTVRPDLLRFEFDLGTTKYRIP
jgi:hypothetical protein